MIVCKKCHEKDRKVTKCPTLFKHHGVSSKKNICEICGKEGEVAYCWRYREYFTNGDQK